MKRTIKFCGRVHENDPLDAGKIVYGSFVDYGDNHDQYRYWIYPIDGVRNYPVDPESVKQLVGFDCDGREAYEDDRLIHPDDGSTWMAFLESNLVLPGYGEGEPEALQSPFKLKETDNEETD